MNDYRVGQHREPPRYGKAKPRRGPIFVYPKETQLRTGRILTPIGGLIIAVVLGGAFWTVVVWRIMTI